MDSVGVHGVLNSHLSSSSDGKISVLVEGNIGAGKTTFLDLSAELNNVEVLTEPVSKWQNLNGTDLLSLLYSDPQRHAFMVQSYMQLTLTELHETPQLKPLRLLERSIFSGRYIFVEHMKRQGLLSNVEQDVLNSWYDWLSQKAHPKVDLVVYVRTDPEVCLQRVRQRARNGEDNIDLSFLEELHELHERWLVQKMFPVSVEVVILDGNMELTT